MGFLMPWIGRLNQSFYKPVFGSFYCQKKEAFFFEKQSKWKVPFVNKHYFLEQQYGWKLYRNDEDKTCMLALRWSPFKTYN